MKPVLLGLLLIIVIALLAAAVWLWTPDRSRADLQAVYLQAPGDLIEIDGVRLHVRDSGPRTAPAVIMLHGFGSSLHTFEPWARALMDTYRVVRFDLPGSGLSEPDPTGVYTDERSMRILIGLMDRLGLDRAALVGNSIGGRLAWRFAAAHPDRVTKLVLISPDGFASPGFAYDRKPEVSAAMTLMRYVLPKSMVRASLAPAYGDPAALTDDVLERYYALMLSPGGREAMIARMQQTVLSDPTPRLRTIAASVLLLWGAKDAMIPVANAADYTGALARSTLVTFPTLGHVPHEEAPEISLAPLRDFLAR